MAALYNLYDNGELVGSYSLKEIAKMLEVSMNTVYDTSAKKRTIKGSFTIEPTEERQTMHQWTDKEIADWEEARHRLNSKAKRRRPKGKSIRYSASAVRFI